MWDKATDQLFVIMVDSSVKNLHFDNKRRREEAAISRLVTRWISVPEETSNTFLPPLLEGNND